MTTATLRRPRPSSAVSKRRLVSADKVRAMLAELNYRMHATAVVKELPVIAGQK